MLQLLTITFFGPREVEFCDHAHTHTQINTWTFRIVEQIRPERQWGEKGPPDLATHSSNAYLATLLKY